MQMLQSGSEINSPSRRSSHAVQLRYFSTVLWHELFRGYLCDIENDVSKRIILKVIALNSFENNVRELRRFIFLTILRTKCDGPPFALYFVRDELIVMNGRRHL